MFINVQSLVKYMLEGLAVAAAAYFIPTRRPVDPKEIALIAVTAAVVFAVLDMLAPTVSKGARLGTGLGLGYNVVGYEGFSGDEGEEEEEEDSKSEDTESEGCKEPEAAETKESFAPF